MPHHLSLITIEFMNKHKDTPHGYHKQEKHTKHRPRTTANSKKSVHKDWRVWVAVGLMLTAMIGYVVSMDESLGPGDERVPAAAEGE